MGQREEMTRPHRETTVLGRFCFPFRLVSREIEHSGGR